MNTSATKSGFIKEIRLRWKTWSAGIAAGLMLSVFGGNALAQSTCTGNSRTETISMPTAVAIPRDSAAGPGTMLTGWFSSPAVTDYFSCSFIAAARENLSSGMVFAWTPSLVDSGIKVPSPDGTSQMTVWKSNVEGVGIALAWRLYINQCGWTAWSARTYNRCNGGSPQLSGMQVQAALVKIGTIKSGTTAAGKYAEGTIEATDTVNGGATVHSNSRISFNLTPTVVTAQTCVVTTPTVQVPLTPAGGIRSAVFTGIGKTYGDTAFSVGVDCSGVKATIAMTLTDPQDPGNRSTTLPLTNVGNAAKGIGIQVLYNNSPVSYGPPLSVAGNTNQFKVFDASGDANAGVTKIDFVGRYVQTAAAVTPGVANGAATFTMSYQ